MFGRQVHKTGLCLDILFEGPPVQKFTNRDELRKVFELGPAGKCAIMDTLESSKPGAIINRNSANYGHILNHPAVIGLAHYDIYDSSKHKPAFQGCKPAPVASRSHTDTQVEDSYTLVPVPIVSPAKSETSTPASSTQDDDSSCEELVVTPPSPTRQKRPNGPTQDDDSSCEVLVATPSSPKRQKRDG